MNHTHYFLHYSHATNPKNKIHTDFDHFLKGISNKIISSFEVEELKRKIEAKVKELNALHHRCNEMKITFYEPLSCGTIKLYGTNVDFSIRPASLTKVELLKY